MQRTIPPLPLPLPLAIARQEGWYLNVEPPARCQRNHNPGNIRFGEFATVHGATGEDDSGFAIFPDDETGMSCLVALMRTPFYASKTLQAGINAYAPPVENQTNIYLQNVCEWTYSSQFKLIGDLMDASPLQTT